MDSSDDNFVWTDASLSPETSDGTLSEETMGQKHNELESEKIYKKKLHKKLFKSEFEVKKELLNGSDIRYESGEESASSAKKVINKHDHHCEESLDKNPKKMKVKHTDDSNEYNYSSQESELLDSHHITKKKKSKKANSSSLDHSQDYQDSKVKEEHHTEHTQSPHKKHKKSKVTYDDNNENNMSSQESELLDSSDHVTKKKKSKKINVSNLDNSQDYPDREVKEEHYTEESHSLDKKLKKNKAKHVEDNTKTSSQESMHSSDHTTKKKKIKRTYSSSSEPAEDYLARQVKKEHQTIDTELKNNEIEHIYDNNENESKESSQECELLESSEYITKKKKSKRNKEKDEEESEMMIEDKFTAEDTIVETRPEKEIPMDVDEEEKRVLENKKDKKSKKNKNNSIQNSTKLIQNDDTIITSDEHEDGHNVQEMLSNTSTSDGKSQKSVPKISDRIQFEDDVDGIIAYNSTPENSNHSSKLRRFLKTNPHLKPISTLPEEDSIISENDELWLFKCSQEINIQSLKENYITLDDNKCKVKDESHTFIGNVTYDINRIALLTYSHGSHIIKNFNLDGVANLRKRIPKPHFVEDNIIANNQTDFIPLPETKCRHPLFGPDYKKAIKISSSVKASLRKSNLIEQPILKQEKKKKKRKYEEVEAVDVVDAGIYEGVKNTRKAHDKDHKTDEDEPPRKKSKHSKKEKKHTGSWDSEKAIEENLFKF